MVGHLNTGSFIHNLIYSFHLPAFIFVSGIFFKERKNIKEFFQKDLKSLIILFLFFAIIWLIFDYVQRYAMFTLLGADKPMQIVTYLKNSAVALLLGNANITGVSFGPVWYLVMIALIRAIYYALNKLIKGKKIICVSIISIICYIIGAFALNGVSNMPYYFASALTGLIFFHIGRLFKTKTKTAENIKPVTATIGALILTVVLGVLVWFTESTNLGNNAYDVPVAVLPVALIGIALLVCTSIVLTKVKIFTKFLSYLGENSLSIMGWHSEIRIVTLFAVSLIGVDNKIIKLIIVLLATLLLCVPFNKITNLLIKVINHKKE